MLVLGYLFMILNYISFCLGIFCREKKWILTLEVLSRLFTILGLYCFNSLTGAYNSILLLIALSILNIRERISDNKMTWLYVIFQSVLCVIFYKTYIGVSSILVFVSSSVCLFHNWFMPPQLMRLIGGCNCVIYLIYQLSIGNWAGFSELIVIVCTFSSYIKYRREEVST